MKNLLILAVVLGLLAYGGAKWHLHNEVGDAMDTAVMMASPFATVEYGGVSSTMTGELTINDVTVVVNGFKDALRIDRVGIDTPSFLTLLSLADFQEMARSGGEMPEYFGFLIEGLRVPVNADYFERLHSMRLTQLDAADAGEPAAQCTGKYGFSPEALTALGYDEQVLSFSTRLHQDDTRFYFDVKSDMVDMWDLEANVTMAGTVMSAVSSGSAYRPRLSDLRVEFTDRSLKSRVERYCGELGLSPEETIRAQVDAFRFIGEANGIVFDEYLMEPYRDYLNGKSTLTITAQPTEPVGLSQIGLYKPSDVPALLNLSAATR